MISSLGLFFLSPSEETSYLYTIFIICTIAEENPLQSNLSSFEEAGKRNNVYFKAFVLRVIYFSLYT